MISAIQMISVWVVNIFTKKINKMDIVEIFLDWCVFIMFLVMLSLNSFFCGIWLKSNDKRKSIISLFFSIFSLLMLLQVFYYKK